MLKDFVDAANGLLWGSLLIWLLLTVCPMRGKQKQE